MSTRRSRFPVTFARPLEHALRATLCIERERGLVSVRLHQRRREYVLPLAWVAETIVWAVAKAEAQDKAQERRKAKAARRATRKQR